MQFLRVAPSCQRCIRRNGPAVPFHLNTLHTFDSPPATRSRPVKTRMADAGPYYNTWDTGLRSGMLRTVTAVRGLRAHTVSYTSMGIVKCGDSGVSRFLFPPPRSAATTGCCA